MSESDAATEHSDDARVLDRLAAASVPLSRLLAAAGETTLAAELIGDVIRCQERTVAHSDGAPIAARRLCTAYRAALGILRQREPYDAAAVELLVQRFDSTAGALVKTTGTVAKDLRLVLEAELWNARCAIERKDAKAAVAGRDRILETVAALQAVDPSGVGSHATRLQVLNLQGHVATLAANASEARSCFVRVLAQLERGPQPWPGFRGEVLLGLARSWYAAGDMVRSRRAFAEAQRERSEHNAEATVDRARSHWLDAFEAEVGTLLSGS